MALRGRRRLEIGVTDAVAPTSLECPGSAHLTSRLLSLLWSLGLPFFRGSCTLP